MLFREKRYDGDFVGPRSGATLYRQGARRNEHGADRFVVALNAYCSSIDFHRFETQVPNNLTSLKDSIFVYIVIYH